MCGARGPDEETTTWSPLHGRRGLGRGPLAESRLEASLVNPLGRDLLGEGRLRMIPDVPLHVAPAIDLSSTELLHEKPFLSFLLKELYTRHPRGRLPRAGDGTGLGL